MDAFETVHMELHERKGIKRPASIGQSPPSAYSLASELPSSLSTLLPAGLLGQRFPAHFRCTGILVGSTPGCTDDGCEQSAWKTPGFTCKGQHCVLCIENTMLSSHW